MKNPSQPKSPDLSDESVIVGESKTAKKREMAALQTLGERLIGLSENELSQIPIESETLREAVALARRIKSNSAQRRQRQYIGKLMRDVDAQVIEEALERLHRDDAEALRLFKKLEQLRDAVVANGHDGVEKVMQTFPSAERQRLRQLSREIQREALKHNPPAASRRLFRYLRELAS
ncbi:MAG: ribosome biogenesis factor YjgA [Pseudomonadota bacterium]